MESKSSAGWGRVMDAAAEGHHRVKPGGRQSSWVALGDWDRCHRRRLVADVSTAAAIRRRWAGTISVCLSADELVRCNKVQQGNRQPVEDNRGGVAGCREVAGVPVCCTVGAS
jgi:hypothetical protein